MRIVSDSAMSDGVQNGRAHLVAPRGELPNIRLQVVRTHESLRSTLYFQIIICCCRRTIISYTVYVKAIAHN